MKYQIIRVYSGLSTATEHTNDIKSALTACAIYLENEDCIMVKIWDGQTKKFVLDFDR